VAATDGLEWREERSEKVRGGLGGGLEKSNMGPRVRKKRNQGESKRRKKKGNKSDRCPGGADLRTKEKEVCERRPRGFAAECKTQRTKKETPKKKIEGKKKTKSM